MAQSETKLTPPVATTDAVDNEAKQKQTSKITYTPHRETSHEQSPCPAEVSYSDDKGEDEVQRGCFGCFGRRINFF